MWGMKSLFISCATVLDNSTTCDVQSKTTLEVIHMANFKLARFTNDIIGKYRNGQSASSLGREYGATTTTITNMLKNSGVMPSLGRGEHKKLPQETVKRIIDLFNDGVRPSEIISETGHGKTTIYTALNAAGVNLRGLDGWKPSTEQLEKKARTKQTNAIMNKSEKVVFNALNKTEFDCVPQFAFGAKNMDFGIPSISVAVEVLCRGTFQLYINNGQVSDRIIELSNRGWHTYIIVSDDSDSIEAGGIDDMLAWLDFIKRQPTARRQYRMVRSPSNLLAAGCSDCNHISSVFSPENIFQSPQWNN